MGRLYPSSVFVLFSVLTFVSAQYGTVGVSGVSSGIQPICGECPRGYQRQAMTGRYCGECVLIQTVPTPCQPNYYSEGTHCLPCPCSHSSGCEKNSDGQFTCKCLPNYTGNNCEACADGCYPSPQSPKECIRLGGPVLLGSVSDCTGLSCPRVPPTLCPGCSCSGQGCACDTCHIQNPPVYFPQVSSVGCPTCNHHHHHCPPCNSQCSSWQPSPCQHPQQCPCPPPCPTCCGGGTGTGTRVVTVDRPYPVPYYVPYPVTAPCKNNCTNPPCPPCPQPPKCPDKDVNVVVNVDFNATTIVNAMANLSLGVTCSVNIKEKPSILPCICDECDTRGTDRIINSIHDAKGLKVIKEDAFCICKGNTQGAKCNECKTGYFGLHKSNLRGCSSCFCSGVSTQCKLAELYIDFIKIGEEVDGISVLKLSNGFVQERKVDKVSSWGSEIKFAFQSDDTEETFYWRLPHSFNGHKVTSYGGVLEFTRTFTSDSYFGSPSAPLSGTNDVIIVSTHGISLYWGSTNSNETRLKVKLDDQSNWLSSRQNYTRLADRRDIMEVLVDIQAIYIRASAKGFSGSELSDVKLAIGTIELQDTSLGLVSSVEHCVCPEGYTGYSCENCSPGFKRVADDLTHGVFGSCIKSIEEKECETLTVSLTPISCTECYDELQTFTCTYTSPKRHLEIAVRTEPDWSTQLLTKDEAARKAGVVYPGVQNEYSRSITIPLLQNLRKVICTVKSSHGDIEAEVKVKAIGKPCPIPFVPPPIFVEVSPDYLCMFTNETKKISCSVVVSPLSQQQPLLTWYKEGLDSSTAVQASEDGVYTFAEPNVSASGTYVCSASDGLSVSHKKVNVVVREVCKDGKGSDGGDNSLMCRVQSEHGEWDLVQGDDPSENEVKVDDTPVQNPISLPTVDAYPNSIKQVVGRPASFRCQTTGATKVIWEAESGQFQPFESSDGLLEFHGVRKNDEGYYICVAQNEFGKAEMKVSLTVVEKKFGVKIDASPPPYQAAIAHPMVLTCESREEVLEFTWSKLGGSLPVHSVQYPNGTLLISSMQESDEGEYVCSAKSSGNETTTAHMNVQFSKKSSKHLMKPEVKLIMRSPLYATIGQNIRIHCQAIGEPSPTLTWTFTQIVDGREFEKVLGAQDRSEGFHEVKSISAADEGNYTCIATNKVGKDEKSLEVFVDFIELKCNGDIEFSCKNKVACIAKEKACDGIEDCDDGSDEAHGMCKRKHPHRHDHVEGNGHHGNKENPK